LLTVSTWHTETVKGEMKVN